MNNMKKLFFILLFLPLLSFSQLHIIAMEREICYIIPETGKTYDCTGIDYVNTSFVFEEHFRYVDITHHKTGDKLRHLITGLEKDSDGDFWIELLHPDGEFLIAMTDHGIIIFILNENKKSFATYYTNILTL